MDGLYGPPLPPGFKLPSENSEDSVSEAKTNSSPKIIGPQIPDFLSKRCEAEPISQINEQEFQTIGPQLPPSFERSDNSEIDDDGSFGPMPIESHRPVHGPAKNNYDVLKDIEKRASNMKNKLENKDVQNSEKVQREEWMVVPDTSRRNQLGAISRCLAPGSKATSSKEKHSHRHSERDKRTASELKKYNKSKRSESLLEMHRKDEKKKKDKSKRPAERKAFDRDEIAVRNFTKQQVNSVIDKAKYLNKRFHAGADHYL